MATNRIGRINEDIQRELASLIRTVKDPRVHGLISITRVDTTADLRYCQGLCQHAGSQRREGSGQGAEIRRGLSAPGAGPGACTLRYTPELQFIEDDSIERGVRMVSMIDRVLEEDEEK